MIDWLRFLLMVFYAPLRGMRGMRDRGSLAPVALMAFLSQAGFNFAMEKFGVVGAGGGQHWLSRLHRRGWLSITG